MDKRGKVLIVFGILIILVLLFGIFVYAGSFGDNWTIDGNKVYVDDSNVYISAEPHTIHECGWVYFNITSKIYEGDVDIVWGFNTIYLKPKKAELYKPHNVTKSYTCPTEYFNYTSNYFWCYRNITTYDNETNETIGSELELIYEHDFEWGNLAEKTAYWNIIENWKDISGVFDSITYNHGGMNKWYYIKNFPIQKDKNYLVRGFIEIPRGNGFSPMKIDEKYWFAIKPSDETIQQAISNKHLYALDPWVDSGGSDVDKDYLDAGLVAYYKLDEQDTSGSGTIYDELGMYNGTNEGATNTTGKINTAYNFTGDDKVNLSDIDDYVTSNALSISAWINPDDYQDAGIVCQATSVQTVMLHMDNAGHAIQFWIWNTAGTMYNAHMYVASGYPAKIGEWTHIIGVFNGTHMRVYVNGTVGETVVTDFSGTIRSSNDLILFGIDFVDNRWFKGQIDEVGIWNRSLNATEISDLWNNGGGVTYVPTVADLTPPNTTTPILNSTDGTNRSNQDLNCYATLTDNYETNLTAYWTWYKNNITNLTGSETVQNNTPFLITTLLSGNISKGEKWKCGVLPYDGYQNGTAQNSSSIIILNTAPNHTAPLLNTSTGKNLSTEDLICYNKSTYDADNDEVINIYNWYKNFQPLLSLNLPFEGGSNSTWTKDYSGNDNDGQIYGATWSSTGNKIGGAYEFDGVDDYIKATKNFGTSFDAFSAEAWVKLKDIKTQHRYILERDDIHFYISIMPGKKVRFRHSDLTNGATETEEDAIEFDEWTHIGVVYNGAKTYIYVNGELEKEQEDTGNISFSVAESLYIGSSKYAPSYPDRTWNGSIDEVKIYSHALTQQQIQSHYVLDYNKIVSEETAGGNNYMCQVTPNDAEADGVTLNSSSLEVLWGISFNVTSGEDGSQLNNFNIECNNSWNVTGANSFEEFGFESGSYECTFSKDYFYDRTKTFTVDDNKVIDVKLSVHYHLTVEEHTWLEAIYECIINKDCDLYNLLLEINETVGNIWEHTKPTDESVVTNRTVINKVVNSTNNLTINYTVNIPIKAGYVSGTYLPVRIGYWFLDTTNTTCYNQGDKPTGVEDPYCQPLVIETIGPMGGSISFTVEMRPELPAGDYNIKEMIDIDPNNIWINYGQEIIGTILLTETLSDSGIDLEKTGEVMPDTQTTTTTSSSGGSSGGGGATTIIKEREIIKLVPQEDGETENEEQEEIGESQEQVSTSSSWLTGGVIGANLLSGGGIVIIVAILCGIFIIFIIIRHRPTIKIKKSN